MHGRSSLGLRPFFLPSGAGGLVVELDNRERGERGEIWLRGLGSG